MKMLRYMLPALLFSLMANACASQITSDELRETGKMSRRDLSTVGSRIVLNAYDFNKPSSTTPALYNDSPVLPLNAAFLTRECSDRATEGRFGRNYRNVVQVMSIKKAGGKGVVASNYTTEWLPYALPFSARYPDGTSISGYDTFSSDSVVLRQMVSDKQMSLRVGGVIKGELQDSFDDVVVVYGSDCKYAVKTNFSENIKYYMDEEAFADGKATESISEAKYWGVDMTDGRQFEIAVSFVLPSVPDEDLVSAVEEPFEKRDFKKALKRQKKYWDDFLADRVPEPSRFDLNNIDTKGVTSDDVKKLYYKAWVNLAQNALAPEDSQYPYWQVVAGKASLWDEGHASSPFSAAWESFVGLQLLGYIDTDIAWSSLKGLLSLVDEDGMLGGESLPSRKAHSAWVLYSLSHDKESLKEIYPAMERYINWRLTQPRWIYMNLTPENEKDAEFVVSVMVDMWYMSKIADVLGMKEEAQTWLDRRAAYFKQYLAWFWDTPQSVPVQYRANYPRRGGFPIQITSGLVLPELQGDYLDGMMRLFYSLYDPDKVFAGFDAPKYPDVDFTVYGLMAKGYEAEAKAMIETFIRDVALTGGMFAETYFDKDGNPDPSGVRPSIFGLAGVIDFVLLRNNYMFTQGEPVLLDLYDEDTSVEHLKVCGKMYSVSKKSGEPTKMM